VAAKVFPHIDRLVPDHASVNWEGTLQSQLASRRVTFGMRITGINARIFQFRSFSSAA